MSYMAEPASGVVHNQPLQLDSHPSDRRVHRSAVARGLFVMATFMCQLRDGATEDWIGYWPEGWKLTEADGHWPANDSPKLDLRPWVAGPAVVNADVSFGLSITAEETLGLFI